ncbi:ABC transporter ATP-binding protein [Intestinibacillus massiliensis]|nr:ABC transporter ATP-binding protein [Intestinibacillus massiliensis]
MITLDNVCKIYDKGGVHALRDINLTVPDGQFLSIIGASGSGKTTLMQILGCLDSPTSGRYLLGGRDVGAMGDRELATLRGREIGFVFQSFRLSPDLNALENVALPLLFRGVPRKEREARAAEALERVGLAGRMRHRPYALSGGQQQRVAIARAVCGSPRLLLADEPTGNLDPRASAEVMGLFDELHAAGHTIILITHDGAVARRAERTAAIEDGRLIQ